MYYGGVTDPDFEMALAQGGGRFDIFSAKDAVFAPGGLVIALGGMPKLKHLTLSDIGHTRSLHLQETPPSRSASPSSTLNSDDMILDPSLFLFLTNTSHSTLKSYSSPRVLSPTFSSRNSPSSTASSSASQATVKLKSQRPPIWSSSFVAAQSSPQSASVTLFFGTISLPSRYLIVFLCHSERCPRLETLHLNLFSGDFNKEEGAEPRRTELEVGRIEKLCMDRGNTLWSSRGEQGGGWVREVAEMGLAASESRYR